MTWQERFKSKIDYKGASDCWKFLSNITKTGYARLKINGKYYKAHRLAYELYNGSIPKGFAVHHTCHNRKCVNPAHLVVGPRSQNYFKSTINIGKHNAIKTHCPKGHSYDIDNTYVNPTKRYRRCKICQKNAVIKSRILKRSLNE